jgi:hypothetical protein
VVLPGSATRVTFTKKRETRAMNTQDQPIPYSVVDFGADEPIPYSLVEEPLEFCQNFVLEMPHVTAAE